MCNTFILKGSLRSRRGINLSVDDAFPMALTASVSPQGTLRDNESKKQKPANKLTTLFSPLSKVRNVKMSSSMTKPAKWHEHPAKTQISLGICPVWSESSLSAQRNLGTLWAHREDSSDWANAQADLGLRWVHMSLCWFCHAVTRICKSYEPEHSKNL